MNTLPVSPVIFVIFLCLIFVLLYLYRTSTIINKKKLFIFIVSLIIVFIGINIIYLHQKLPPKQHFRLAVMPLTMNTGHEVDREWLSYYIPEMLAKTLYHTVQNRAVVAPIEWTYHAVQADSLSEPAYQTKLTHRIHYPHILFGTLSQTESGYRWSYQIVTGEGIRHSETISFTIDDIHTAIATCVQQSLAFFSVPEQTPMQPKFSESIDALQNFTAGFREYLKANYGQAAEFTEQAIAFDNSFAEAFTLAGICHLNDGIRKRIGDHSAAIPDFERTKYFTIASMKLDSTSDETYRILGEYYIYNERWSEADRLLKRAFQLNSNNPLLYIPLSRLHSDRFRKYGFSDEEALYQRAIYINPCYAPGYLGLADHYLFNNKRDDAIAILKQYLSIDPYSVPALMALGKIYIVRNEIMNIIQVLTKVIELDSTNSDAYYNLGILYYNSNDFKNAKQLFEKAISIDNHLNSYLYLAYLSEAEGNKDMAVDYLRKRIRFKTGPDDQFAEEARKHLFELMHADSTRIINK